MNLFVPPSVTREYHSKVLELFHLLQCIAAHLQHTLTWVSGEIHYLGYFSADIYFGLVARSSKPIKCTLKTLQHQTFRQKQTIDPGAPKSDTLVDSAVTVYPIYIDYDEEW